MPLCRVLLCWVSFFLVSFCWMPLCIISVCSVSACWMPFSRVLMLSVILISIIILSVILLVVILLVVILKSVIWMGVLLSFYCVSFSWAFFCCLSSCWMSWRLFILLFIIILFDPSPSNLSNSGMLLKATFFGKQVRIKFGQSQNAQACCLHLAFVIWRKTVLKLIFRIYFNYPSNQVQYDTVTVTVPRRSALRHSA